MKRPLDELLSTRPGVRRLAIGVSLVVLGLVDHLSGYEYSFSVFYLLPVYLAAWYDRRGVAVATMLAAAATWLGADLLAGHPYSHEWIPVWNALVRLGFFAVVAALLRTLRAALAAATDLAMTDALTALGNARAFGRAYRGLRETSLRTHAPLSVGVIDLDGFKAVNDAFGHSKGDEILAAFAAVLTGATRASDVLVRLGGDEFAVLLPDTDEAGARAYASRLREHFERSDLRRAHRVDFSMGVAVFPEPPSDPDRAAQRADELMYVSKARGKGQTVVATP